MFSRVVPFLLFYSVISIQAAVLFPTGSTWRFLRGTNEASFPDTLAWTGSTNNFNDSKFVDAPAPFWYGDIREGGTQLLDMQNNYTCIFLRKGFMVTNAAQYSVLRLNYFVDDGLVVWVNGQEIWRDNVATGPVSTNTLAGNQPIDPAVYTNITINTGSGVLLNGSNTLAVQVFNTSAGSSDLGFDLSLEAFVPETIPPTLFSVSPEPGSVLTNLNSITVTFSEPVVGVTADDFLIDTQPANSVTGSGTNYTFTFNTPPYGGVFITWFPDPGIYDLALPPNAFDAAGSSWAYQLNDETPPFVSTLFPSAGSTVRALTQVEVTFSEEVNGVDAADLRVNGQPAASVSRIPGGPYVFQLPAVAAGTVNLQWAGTHGIVDQAQPANAFGGGAWTYVLDPNVTVGNLVITEIVASNQEGLADEEGEAEDWIEIQNRGATPVDLGGWSLSDDPELSSLWVFPTKVLGAGQFLVVFASGKDRKTPTGANRFHTNFRLKGGGGFLGLYNGDSPRVLVSGFFEYPEQRNDFSYGYEPQGALRYFATPTPGASNGTSTIHGVAEPVHFSTPRGFFTQPFTLNLTCPTPGAEIRYTTNGADPTLLNSYPYLGPLPIAGTTVLRAAAFRSNLLSSVTKTHSYFFNQNAAIRSLPVISITTATSNLYGRFGILGMGGGSRASDGLFLTNNPATDYHNPSAHGIAWERPVSMEYIKPEDNSGFQIDGGIRVQGSDWQRPRTMPNSKFSYRVYFRGDYGPGRLEYPLYPHTTLQSFDQVVLRAGYNEPNNPFIRDEVGRRTFGDMGNVTSQGTLAHIFTNGFYAGLYNPCERVNEAFGQSHHGGSPEWDVVGPDFAQSSEGPGVVDGDRNDFRNLHNYINGQSAASIVTPAVYNEIARRLELPNFVDYCLVNVYSAMGDWPANNWRAGKDRGPGGIWRFYVWDAEWGLGFSGRGFTRDTFAETGPGPSDSGLASTANSEIARMYQSLRRSPEFRLLWADRIYKHFFNGGALTEVAMTNRLNELRDQLAVVFALNVSEIGPFVANRRANIFDDFQLYGLFGYSNALYGVYASSNAPAFNRHGGPVPPGFSLTMSAPLGGTIYYTTDGSDPRVPFTGAISNAATAYVGPLTLVQSGLIKARTLLNTNWSALAEASFAVGTLGIPIRLTEIMYNPTGGSIYEFIELQNIGAVPLDLGGMFFSEGIEFTFNAGTFLAPGARLVLANGTDPNAFASRYPGVTPRGYFNGNLNNAGERLTLRDVNGRITVSVNFRDNNGWPTPADGAGYSLELMDPLGNPDDGANWRASSALNGSPGTAGTAPPPAAVRINEVLAFNVASVANGATHPDYVELLNTSASPVNLTGWSLSDDGTPGEFPFPGGTTVPANGFLVVWCDSVTNTTPGLHAGFELDPDGDGVFLYDAASNRVDAVTFGAQAADFSLGRIGNTWVVNTPTAGAPNTAAPVGSAFDLVLNEWMANPPPGQSDWVELYNTSATLPVPLYGIYVGTTGIVHRISSLSVIRPGGYLQLFADEGVGADHLNFRLPAAGGAIVLQNEAAQQVQRVDYAAQVEGVSQGRLPDGAVNIVSFPGTASPEAPNYAATYTGPVLNEVLARNVKAITNAGRVADFVEFANPTAAPASLAGMSLSVGNHSPGQWLFPATAVVPANGYLVIWCDGGRPASTNAGNYNTGRALDGESGGVYLFNASGQLVNFVEYGPQLQDLSIGLSGGQWRLLSAPTPGAANAAAAATGVPTALRFNEWLANPATGADWLEVYNQTNLPIELAGLRVTDDLSLSGTNEFVVPPLSYIGARGFVRWVADSDPAQGRNHANFSLDAQGEGLRLLSASGLTLIDTVVFGAQALGISEGRLPDGTGPVTRFPGSASPAEANYVLIPNLVLNEILTHTDPPLEDAVELFNPGPSLNVGGWFLSNTQDDFKKYRVPDNTIIAANGYLVLYEGQFNTGAGAFTLNSAHGDEVWLSAADALGNLTGARITAKVGPALNGVSFGRVVTSVGIDYAALASRTFGQDTPPTVTQFRTGGGLPNAAPRVGPILINEIHYNPPPGPGEEDEFVELYNNSGAEVSLFHSVAVTNTWKLEGGIDFTFPGNVTIPAAGYALVVGFNPDDAAALAAFRSRLGVSASVPVFGPFQGKLDNGGETITLVRPDTPQAAGQPDAGFVPYVVADRVEYGDQAPWPVGAVDGGGLSLQRKSKTLYGNEPLNWVAANPTPGANNGTPLVNAPVVTTQPASQTVFEGATPGLTVAASGSGPLQYQWRLNRTAIPDATNNTYAFDFALSQDTGSYDVIVSNPGGSTLSQSASLRVVVPPIVLLAPTNIAVRPSQTATFGVVVRGDAPLAFQWRRNGIPLAGETNSSIIKTNVQLADEGTYDVVVTNPVGTTSVGASLLVLINPVLILNPISQVVPVGGQVSLSAAWTGNPPPFNVEWRKTQPAPTTTNFVVTQQGSDVFTFTASATPFVTNQYRLVIKNLANTAGIGSPIFTVITVPDTDHDGLPDFWEDAYGLAAGDPSDRDLDSDHDGVSNWREFIAGTDPTNPASYLRVDLTLTPGSASVQFNAASNKTYSVQYTDALRTPWLPLIDVLARTNNHLESIPDPTWTTNRFYRLVTPAAGQ
jgi:hypothetical protein